MWKTIQSELQVAYRAPTKLLQSACRQVFEMVRNWGHGHEKWSVPGGFRLTANGKCRFAHGRSAGMSLAG